MGILNDGGNAGNGAGLISTNHPLLITEGMVAAGLKAAEAEWRPDSNWTNAVKAIYEAMVYAAPSESEDISDDAIVEAEIDLSIPEALIERVAKAIAHGHGAKMVYQDREGQMQTVASMAGFGRWGRSASEYAEKHWEQYKLAAELAIDAARRT